MFKIEHFSLKTLLSTKNIFSDKINKKLQVFYLESLWNLFGSLLDYF